MSSTACTGGDCGIVSCDAGWDDCNGSYSDGCETDMRSATSCGTSCGELTDCTSLAHVSGASCTTDGSCSVDGCDDGYAECDDLTYNGCERLLDDDFGSCSGATDIGSVSGDTGSDSITRSSFGEYWYKVRVDEDSSSSLYVSARIQLDVPEGLDYDLYVHCAGCSSPIATGFNGSGSDEDLRVSWADEFGVDDGQWLYVEVRHFSGSTLQCGGWTLTVTGNQADSTRESC